MSKIQDKKEVWLAAMADYMLEHGISGSSLRPLAKAAGTSDRMLIYHFESKEKLINEILKHLFGRLADDMTNMLPTKKADTRLQCIRDILDALKVVGYKRYMRIWLEIIGYSTQQQNSYTDISHQLVDDILAWISVYVPGSEPDPERTAKAILVLIEGENVLSSIGREDIAIDGIEFLIDT
jgi:AcrR family transcriptional regulator